MYGRWLPRQVTICSYIDLSGHACLSSIGVCSRITVKFAARILSFVLFLFSVAVPAPAAENQLLLQCQGSMPTYPNGFGAPLPQTEDNSVRFVEINPELKTVSLDTLFGQRSTALNPISDDKYFSFSVRHDVPFRGKTVSEEHVSINRYTGEIHAYYTFDPPLESSLGYSAFSGVCKMASQRF